MEENSTNQLSPNISLEGSLNVIEQRQNNSDNLQTNENKAIESISVQTINDIVSTVQGGLEQIKSYLRENDYKDRINKELHEELQIHRNNLKREITIPFIKSIIQVYDKIDDIHSFYSKNNNETEIISSPYFRLLQEYKNISLEIIDLLYAYDIELFPTNVNDDFLPKRHKVIEVVITKDEKLAKKIIECKKDGFIDIITERIIRPAEVILYKYE